MNKQAQTRLRPVELRETQTGRLARALSDLGTGTAGQAKDDDRGAQTMLYEQRTTPAQYNPHRRDTRHPYTIYLHNCRALDWPTLTYGEWLSQAKREEQAQTDTDGDAAEVFDVEADYFGTPDPHA